MKINAGVLCPYCNVDNKPLFEIKGAYLHSGIVHCDEEVGGCGKDFLIYVRPTFVIDTCSIRWEREFNQ